MCIFVFSEEVAGKSPAGVSKTNLRDLELVFHCRTKRTSSGKFHGGRLCDGRTSNKSFGQIARRSSTFSLAAINGRKFAIDSHSTRSIWNDSSDKTCSFKTDLISRFYGFLLTSIDLLVPDFSFLSKMKSKFKTYNINMNMTKMKKV